jgi:hypothetical protein
MNAVQHWYPPNSSRIRLCQRPLEHQPLRNPPLTSVTSRTRQLSEDFGGEPQVMRRWCRCPSKFASLPCCYYWLREIISFDNEPIGSESEERYTHRQGRGVICSRFHLKRKYIKTGCTTVSKFAYGHQFG